jgi:hypothetical protein
MGTMRTIINVAAFQAAWFAAVLGAARGFFWLGPLAVTLGLACHLSLQPERLKEISLAMAAGVMGFLFDSGLIAGGVFAPVRDWMPFPFSPLWMVCLWINFATLLNVSLQWLHGRYALAAVLGAVGGPAAYYSGARLGAMQNLPGMGSLLVLSLAWSMAVPVLLSMVAITRRYSRDR